jgi:cell division protein FtsN
MNMPAMTLTAMTEPDDRPPMSVSSKRPIIRPITRPRARRLQAGRTMLFGLMVGVVIGLLIAVITAVYTTRSSVPFVNKVQRPAEQRAVETKGEGLPDPNRGWQRGPSEEAVAPPEPPAAAVPDDVERPQAAIDQDPPGTFNVPGAPAGEPPAAERATYLLQAGAFRSPEDADAMKAKLALIGFEARIISADVNGTLFYRVRVGPYVQLEDMNRARYRLAENGIESSVVRQR